MNENTAESDATLEKSMISTPFNPVHITHVGYDHNVGEFTVCYSMNDCLTLSIRAFLANGIN